MDSDEQPRSSSFRSTAMLDDCAAACQAVLPSLSAALTSQPKSTSFSRMSAPPSDAGDPVMSTAHQNMVSAGRLLHAHAEPWNLSVRKRHFDGECEVLFRAPKHAVVVKLDVFAKDTSSCPCQPHRTLFLEQAARDTAFTAPRPSVNSRPNTAVPF